MNAYRSRCSKLAGTSYEEVMKLARNEYHAIQRANPRRKAYVRSAYFNKNKVFLDQFWDHLKQKSPPDKYRRLKYYKCALDLLIYSTLVPTIKNNPNRGGEKLYRFMGRCMEGELYVVQVKRNEHDGRSDFMSVFPFK